MSSKPDFGSSKCLNTDASKRISMFGAQARVPPPPPPPTSSLQMEGSKVLIKKLNWTTILSYKLSKNSVWIKYAGNHPLSDDICDRLAENFASKPAKKVLSTKSNIRVRVIDMKNAQNILILLRTQYKHSSHEEIKNYILHCDTTMLNVNIIDGLIKSLTQAHQIQLRKLKFDGVQLIDVEEFLASLCDINRLLPRLHSIKFKAGYDVMVHKLESDMNAVMAACEDVVTCKKFHRILHVILLFGNFMNAGSNIGGAVAFELSVLARLNELKYSDNRQTLLGFLVETLKEKQPDLLNFGDDLIHLHEAAHVNTNDVDEAIKEIDGMLEYIKAETKSADESFVNVMLPFTSKCNQKLQELLKMKEYMQIRCIEVADFFAFDMKNYRIGECFKDIATFKGLFAQKSIEMAEPENMTRRAQRLHHKPTGSKETKPCSVVCRDFNIKLDRLTKEEIELATGKPSSRKRVKAERLNREHSSWKRKKVDPPTTKKDK